MLFIDANIYLEFYNSSKDNLKKLLPALDSIAQEIFVTRQVANEVERNKVKITGSTFSDYLTIYKPASVRLPEHLEDGTQKSAISNWNKDTAEITKNVKAQQGKLSEITSNLVSEVMRGEDATWQVLSKIFANAVEPTANEIELARSRRELGNPPGKVDDPLGDQLSWEQILSRVSDETELWLISNDNDYSTPIDRKRYLNPFLWREVNEKASTGIQIHIFDSLADGLKAYNESRKTPIELLPSAEELKVIADEENTPPQIQMPDPYRNYIGCLICGKDTLKGPAARPSMYGGWTMQWFCTSCNKWIDLGEPYDD